MDNGYERSQEVEIGGLNDKRQMTVVVTGTPDVLAFPTNLFGINLVKP